MLRAMARHFLIEIRELLGWILRGNRHSCVDAFVHDLAAPIGHEPRRLFLAAPAADVGAVRLAT